MAISKSGPSKYDYDNDDLPFFLLYHEHPIIKGL